MFRPLAAALAVALLALPVPAPAQDAAEGRALFERHCAVCHGLDATGSGPMAPVLTIQPVDLTALAATNGGAFPVLRVIRRIDGREPLVSHGSPMPIFGDFFAGGRDVAVKSETGQPVMASKPIADLVAYLRSLQDPSL